jgi:hypothetical protein
MNNLTEDIATYVLFGDEAVSIYRVSIKQLLKTNNIDYTVGEYQSVKEFFKEKDNWGNYIEIGYSDYKTIKTHLDTKLNKDKKRKKRFSFFNLFE